LRHSIQYLDVLENLIDSFSVGTIGAAVSGLRESCAALKLVRTIKDEAIESTTAAILRMTLFIGITNSAPEKKRISETPGTLNDKRHS
jgi:hypothetical protein